MKTNTTNQTAGRARVQIEQSQAAEFNKYIVVLWNGKEQVTVFPFATRHADVLDYLKTEYPDVQAVSAGFYIQEPDAFWCGGESDSLNLKSRPQDREALQAFFRSDDRGLWDLTQLTAQAREAARQEMREAGWCSR